VSVASDSENINDEADKSADDNDDEESKDSDTPEEEESARHDEGLKENTADNESSSTAEVSLAPGKEPQNDDDSNASDDSFELDEDKVEEEAERDRVLDEIEENINGNDEAQQDHFNSASDEVSAASDSENINDKANKLADDDKEEESKDSDPPEEEESARHDEGLEENTADDESSSTAEVSSVGDEEPQNDDEPEVVNKPRMRFEVQSSLGSYWGDGLVGTMMDTESAAADIMQEYGEMTASIATPQYNFKKGI